jgi:hypothetical protein
MDKQSHKKSFVFKRLLQYLITIVLIFASYYLSFKYVGPLIERTVSKYQDAVDSSNASNPELQKSKIENRGLRTANVTKGYQELPKNIVSEETYKDVKLISTPERKFSTKEISILKSVIDAMPQKLFDYRPWAIVSTNFNQNEISHVNPEGVAFTSGPYIFVSDITFEKQDSYDTGTYRGLVRIFAHEFTHVAQFFEVKKDPEVLDENYLENTDFMMSWIKSTGWQEQSHTWILNKDEVTTTYGATSPIEDIADSVGSMVVGEEFAVSQDRIDWIINWLGISKQELFVGTIPLTSNLKQRKTDAGDAKFLTKYKDNTAVMQDVINFQNTQEIGIKELVNFYNSEFKKRGWTGSVNSNGAGELVYQNKVRINMEIDKNPLRVVTMVVSLY